MRIVDGQIYCFFRKNTEGSKKGVQQILLQAKPFQKFVTFGKVFHNDKASLWCTKKNLLLWAKGFF
jgi:hypothetical protein